jgi:UDP-N-acetyl-alpha-D-muramoyl-L-alanyl-L-glutamate epimerase
VRFRYDAYEFDAASSRLRCRYSLDDISFEETVTFSLPAGAVAHETMDHEPADERAIDAAARLVFLLAGISYFKVAAPPVIEVPRGLRAAERALLGAFYRSGLAEYAYRNDLDLSGLRIEAPELPDVMPAGPPDDGRVLIPFGGGIDSIVTVEGLRDGRPRRGSAGLALFVMSRDGDSFDAIEAGAAVTGLPIVRAARSIDEKVLRSAELGYLNGHVPVTGILSSIAVMAALLDGRGAVAMSNEWSASMGNLEWNGMVVNHQWSKSLEFEDLFRAAVRAALPIAPDEFSWLRSRSELWVAQQFAELTAYHRVFRSCNRAFQLDPARRLDHWCGTCDKCCFIDLILSPFLSVAELDVIFDGREPLADPDLTDRFRSLLDLSGDPKPFECVGDVDECRVAVLLAAARPDRRDTALVQALAAETRVLGLDDPAASADALLRPLGPHRIPPRHAPSDLLV